VEIKFLKQKLLTTYEKKSGEFQGFRRSSDVIYFPTGTLSGEYNFNFLFSFYFDSSNQKHNE